MDSLKNRLLSFYGYAPEDYESVTANPSFSSVPRIDEEDVVKEAISLIQASIAANQKILIYGDYDADGILATSILVRTFLKLHKHVSFFIPSRYQDGYGLTMENAKKIAKSGYGLVILVDNGVSCFEEVGYLRSEKINVLIIDHHELPASLPMANAILHDGLLRYGNERISAGCLSFLFSIPLLKEVDPYLLTLGAMSLITDMMAIKGQNRTLVGLALRMIRKYQFPEIFLLTDKKIIDEKVLGLEIGPKINAVGRMQKDHSMSKLVHFFAELESKNKFDTAAWTSSINEGRKKAVNDAVASLLVGNDDPGVLLVTNTLEGLNGALAGRLVSVYNKPTIVMCPSEKDKSIMVGSFRSKEGCSFLAMQEELSKYLLRSGGHLHAGGFSLKASDFLEFKQGFFEFCKKNPHVKKEAPSIPLLLEEVNMESYKEIRKFGPFGHEYEEPLFEIANIPSKKLEFHRNGFMKTSLQDGNSLISFSMNVNEPLTDLVTLLGHLRLNYFNGKTSIDFHCDLAKDS